ncbi:MAG: hypothetical protein Q4E13_04050 [Clostridia bacterium]|nr:hypothetical protein [Clostridia bacterium]
MRVAFALNGQGMIVFYNDVDIRGKDGMCAGGRSAIPSELLLCGMVRGLSIAKYFRLDSATRPCYDGKNAERSDVV